MEKKIFFIIITIAIFFSNCMKENIKRDRVGGTPIIMYDMASARLFSKEALAPTCIDGVKKAGAREVITVNALPADGVTGSTATASTFKACSAVGIE